MHMRLAFAIGLLVVTTVHAQDLPLKSGAQDTNNTLTSDRSGTLEHEQNSAEMPLSNEMFSNIIAQPLPDKPQPIAHEGDWFYGGDQLRQFSDDLVIVAEKNDGRMMWHVKRVNSCVWCGAPMTWKQAMFDKKSSSMWAMRSALMVADIEITHHMPCFQSGACRESNPLIGHTRLQGYSVGAALTAIPWITDAWLRKGSRKYSIGGYKHWWIVPVIGDAASAVGIIMNLASWKNR